MGATRADRTADDGRYLIVADPGGAQRLWLRSLGPPMAIVLPLDDAFELRLGLAQRLFRRLRGKPFGPLPPRLQVTPFQRHRLALLLRIFDRLGCGATKRQIACELVYPGFDPGPAAEWKASAERRRTQRLCDEARAMVAVGYRRLLGGR